MKEEQTAEFGWVGGSYMSSDNSIDRAIRYCQLHDLNTVPIAALPNCKPVYNSTLVRVGNIVFDCHSHGTGNCVRGWILNEANEAFEFLIEDYWFSHLYTFNKSKHVYGAWDNAVESAHAVLKGEMLSHIEERKNKARAADETAQESFNSLKSEFEFQFKDKA